MGRFVAGQVVVVKYPFSDFSTFKKRPALVLGESEYENYLLCLITSKSKYENAIEITEAHFEEGGLSKTSYIRPSILMTVKSILIDRAAGKINRETHELVIEGISAYLRENTDSE